MRVALFVPCYVDQLRPAVGFAALRLLERAGHDVEVPEAQTCCGQPLLNSGARGDACRLAHRFLDLFSNFDRVVCPSASCVATVTEQFTALLGASPRLDALRASMRELCAFLVEEGDEQALAGARFPHRVGLHASCHALRGLRQGPASERPGVENPDPARALLSRLDGLSFAEPARADECCGFGGSFAVEEAAVSARMGQDRLAAHADAGSEVLASTDVSCLLHLDGLARRSGRPLRALHVAEILVEALDAA